MLENDLNMRNQFASKIIDKVKKINNDIKLLSKVDKQLLKNINKKGGNIENFHINKIGGGPALTDTDRQLKIAQTQLKLQEMAKLKDKLEKIKKAKEDNDFKNSATADANSNSIRKLSGIITRLEEFIKLFDQLNEMVSAYEVPDLGDFIFRDLKKIDTSEIDRLERLIPSGLTIFSSGDLTVASSNLELLKIEYKELVKKQIPKYTFVQTSGSNDYTQEVIWNDTTTISNVGGAYYAILDKLLVDPVLKLTFSKDNLDYIHKQLNITEPDTTIPDIKPVYDAYTYLNKQKELKEEKENIIKESNLVLKDPSKSADHAAANVAITNANAVIAKIDILIPMAQKNYEKMIGNSADKDIDERNIQILDNAQTTITNNEAALTFLRPTGGNITSAAAAAATATNVAAQTILNALTPATNNVDNITNLEAFITDLKTEFNTATAINALRIAIRENPNDNDIKTINTKITPPISVEANTIITDAIAVDPTIIDPRVILDSLKSKTHTTMVGGGRSSRHNSSRTSRHNSSRTSRHNSSRTSRHDSSSTSRHSGW